MEADRILVIMRHKIAFGSDESISSQEHVALNHIRWSNPCGRNRHFPRRAEKDPMDYLNNSFEKGGSNMGRAPVCFRKKETQQTYDCTSEHWRHVETWKVWRRESVDASRSLNTQDLWYDELRIVCGSHANVKSLFSDEEREDIDLILQNVDAGIEFGNLSPAKGREENMCLSVAHSEEVATTCADRSWLLEGKRQRA